MQCCLAAAKDRKNKAQGVILEGFGITVVSLWTPNGTPEAVLFEVEILMAKRSLQECARAGGSRGGVPLKLTKDWRLEARRLEGLRLEASLKARSQKEQLNTPSAKARWRITMQ